MKGAAIYFISIMGLLALFALSAYLWLPDTSLASDVTRIVQASVTAIAIAAGGVFAGVKLQVFRDFAPHVTIHQTVSHRAIGDSYVHIFVTATLHNSSKVRLDFRRGFFRIQGISPLSDVEVEETYADVFVMRNNRDFQWQTIDEAPREWSKNDLIVEPGESHPETCEFIVSREVKAVVVHTYMYNSKHPAIPQGWGATTAHDIIIDTES